MWPFLQIFGLKHCMYLSSIPCIQEDPWMIWRPVILTVFLHVFIICSMHTTRGSLNDLKTYDADSFCTYLSYVPCIRHEDPWMIWRPAILTVSLHEFIIYSMHTTRGSLNDLKTCDPDSFFVLFLSPLILLQDVTTSFPFVSFHSFTSRDTLLRYIFWDTDTFNPGIPLKD
jgi:hypothetical protein